MTERTDVEMLGIPRPSGDWATLRSSARQAESLAGVLEDAAGRVVGAPAGVWEGRAGAQFDTAAYPVRTSLLEAAGSIRRVATALLPLARAIEEAQEQAERALLALQAAEEERLALLGPDRVADLSGRGDAAILIPDELTADVHRVQKACRLARAHAERECAEAVEVVDRADRIAAAVVEDEAMRAPVCIALPPAGPWAGAAPSGDKAPGLVESFIEGAVMGDLSNDDSGASVWGQVLTGFIPVVGQVADIRDIIAAVDSRDWAGLPLVAAGIVPGLDFLKVRKLNRVEMDLVARCGPGASARWPRRASTSW